MNRCFFPFVIINATEAQENKIDRDTTGGSFVHC